MLQTDWQPILKVTITTFVCWINQSNTYENAISLVSYFAKCIKGPNPPAEEKHFDNGMNLTDTIASNLYSATPDSNLIQMASPKKLTEGPGSIIEIKDWSLISHGHQIPPGTEKNRHSIIQIDLFRVTVIV